MIHSIPYNNVGKQIVYHKYFLILVLAPGYTRIYSVRGEGVVWQKGGCIWQKGGAFGKKGGGRSGKGGGGAIF